MKPENKDIHFDICMDEGKEDIKEFFKQKKRGIIKPLIMWGCKLCKERMGVSNFSMYDVEYSEESKFFCSKHGFLNEDQAFRRKRMRMKSKRDL